MKPSKTAQISRDLADVVNTDPLANSPLVRAKFYREISSSKKLSDSTQAVIDSFSPELRKLANESWKNVLKKRGGKDSNE